MYGSGTAQSGRNLVENSIAPAAIGLTTEHHARGDMSTPCIFAGMESVDGTPLAEPRMLPGHDCRASAMASVSMYCRKREILPSFTVQTCA